MTQPDQLAITAGLERGSVVRLNKPGRFFHGYRAIVLGRDERPHLGLLRVQVIYPLLYADPTPHEPFAPMYLSGPIWFETGHVVRIEAT